MLGALSSCRPLVERPSVRTVPSVPEPVREPPREKTLLAWPLADIPEIRVLSGFGVRPGSAAGTLEPHHGLDLAAAAGAHALAAGAGRVAYAGRRPFFDGVVILSHPGRWQTVYANLESVLVSAGDSVETGTELGVVGMGCDTGSEPCLHFELRLSGVAVEPLSSLPAGRDSRRSGDEEGRP